MPTTTITQCIVSKRQRLELECGHCKHVWFPKRKPRLCPKCKYVLDDRARKPISKDVIIHVAARCGGKCVQCGATERLSLDHIIPFSKGGTCDEANLQILCLSCNRKKGAKYDS